VKARTTVPNAKTTISRILDHARSVIASSPSASIALPPSNAENARMGSILMTIIDAQPAHFSITVSPAHQPLLVLPVKNIMASMLMRAANYVQKSSMAVNSARPSINASSAKQKSTIHSMTNAENAQTNLKIAEPAQLKPAINAQIHPSLIAGNALPVETLAQDAKDVRKKMYA